MKLTLAISVLVAAAAMVSGEPMAKTTAPAATTATPAATAATTYVNTPMRDTVLPTFDVVSGGASTVTMSVVLDYFAKIEDADLATYADAMSVKKNQKTAETRITNYYDAAVKCAKKKKKKLTKAMTLAQYNKVMKKVKRCLNKKNMPVFRMAVSGNTISPDSIDTSVSEDNAAAEDDVDDADDDDEDTTDAPATTTATSYTTSGTTYATATDTTTAATTATPATAAATTTDTSAGTTATSYTTPSESGTTYATSGETGTGTTSTGYTTSGVTDTSYGTTTGTTDTSYAAPSETSTGTIYTTSGETATGTATSTTDTSYTTPGETGTSYVASGETVTAEDPNPQGYDTYDSAVASPDTNDVVVGLPNPYVDDEVTTEDYNYDDMMVGRSDNDNMVVGMPNPYADVDGDVEVPQDVDGAIAYNATDAANPNLRGSDEEPIADQPIAGETGDAAATNSAMDTVEEHYEAPVEVDVGGFGGITEADVVATGVEIPLSDMPAADDAPTSIDDIPTGLQTPSEVQELGAADIEIPEQEQAAIMIAEAELVQPLIVGGDESSLPPPDWVLYGPESMEDAVATASVRGAYPFKPASRVVPPFWAIDFDDSTFVTPHEWGNYVGTLKELALVEAAKTRDGWALGLLTNIINYHYANLGDCIGEHFSEVGADDMDNATFEPFASWVQDHCYVKFRYSLFAGPPPFEWIARNEPAVSATQVKSWIDSRLETAKNDLAAKRVYGLTAEDVVVHEALAKCAFAFLDEDSSAMIDRDAFYQALTEIVACAAESAT